MRRASKFIPRSKSSITFRQLSVHFFDHLRVHLPPRMTYSHDDFATLCITWDEVLQHFCLLGEQPASPKAKYAPDRKEPGASGHTYFVLSRAKPSNNTSASGMPAARTHLKRCVGNTDDNLRNWVQLPGVIYTYQGWNKGGLELPVINPPRRRGG